MIWISRRKKVLKSFSREHQYLITRYIEALKREEGVFPVQRGSGRPTETHRHLLIAVKVAELIRDGATEAEAIGLVLAWHNKEFSGTMTAASIRDICHGRDPEWRRLVRVELSRRAYEAQLDEMARRSRIRSRAELQMRQNDSPRLSKKHV